MFSGANDIEKGMKHNFTGCKPICKVNLMYLEIKLKEVKFQ